MCVRACAGWVGARGLRVYRVKDPGVLFRLPKFGHSRKEFDCESISQIKAEGPRRLDHKLVHYFVHCAIG